MPSIRARLSHAFEQLSKHGLWRYALVPLLLATLNGTKIQSVLTSSYDFHAGFRSAFPSRSLTRGRLFPPRAGTG